MMAISDGAFCEIHHFSHLSSGDHYVIVPNGMTPEGSAPKFMKSRKDTARVKKLFADWDNLNERLSDMELPGVTSCFTQEGLLSTVFDELASK